MEIARARQILWAAIGFAAGLWIGYVSHFPLLGPTPSALFVLAASVLCSAIVLLEILWLAAKRRSVLLVQSAGLFAAAGLLGALLIRMHWGS